MYPILFEIPGLELPIYSYGVMLGLSIIAGWYLTLALGERDGLPRKAMGSCYFWGIAAALVGARLLYVMTNPGNFSNLGDFFRFRDGGLVAYGGFLGGLVGSAIYCRVKKVRIWAWADATAAPIALGLAVTRIGCFLYGCCYGRRVTDDDPSWLEALTVRFPNWSERFSHLSHHELHGSPAFLHHVTAFGLDPSVAASYPIVCTQMMASINGFIAVAILLTMRRYRQFRGQIFLTFGAYYGFTRFFFEILRDDRQRGTVGPPVLGWFGGLNGAMTTSQLIGVITVISCVGGMIYLGRKAKRDPEAAMFLGEGAVAAQAEETSKESATRRGSKRSSARRRKKK